MKQIENNSTLTSRFIGDSSQTFTCLVLERSKTMCIVLIEGVISRKKIYNNGESEFIYPFGKYSMAPIAKPI